jgi:hypothetical protein
MNAEQKRLEGQLRALPDPLPGDPGELRDYADFLLREAYKAGELKDRQARMPGRIFFVSDGALRLYANMSEVAGSYGKAHDVLHHAGMTIRQHAAHVQQSQDEWKHTSRRLVDAISRLEP